ncbi:MAG: site-specific integrase [Pseudonocardiales bacterium]
MSCTRGLFRLHIEPHLSHLRLDQVTTAAVRTWRAALLDAGASATTVAKAYRLLRAVFNTAVDDRAVRENPCRIKGADKEPTPERPTVTVAQVYRLADRMPTRLGALILFAAFTGLRWGELIALRRCDLDLAEGAVRVPRKFAELRDGTRVAGPPKTAAGIRTAVLPAVLVPVMREHLAAYVEDGTEALIFTGSRGAALRRTNFHKAASWADNIKAAGLPSHFHFHDLRHTGNTLAAASGASTRELMHRMGHASMRAALIYQHATSERDREIASELSKRIEAQQALAAEWQDEQSTGDDDEDGAAGAPTNVG